jgi:nitroreductase
MTTKHAVTDHPIHALLRERWSPRAFDSAPLTPDQIRPLLEAARWSPSGGNGQPWRFIVAPRGSETFDKVVGTLNEGNVVWAQHAPLLLVAVAQTVRDNGQPSPVALYDLGQAVAHLSVQAVAAGLWTHQMGGFSKDNLREAFAIPEGFQPVTVTAIGRLGDIDRLDPGLRERELAPRSRKPLAEIAFGDTWGEAAPVVASAEVAE